MPTLEIRDLPPLELDLFYDNFSGPKTFLQSATYGQFRALVGEEVFYLGLYKGEKLVGSCIIQKIKTRFKTFLHTPHGPLISEPAVWEHFLNAYKALGEREKCDFVRISPLLSPEQESLFKAQKYKPAAIHLVNPEKTWVLDITKTEDELLAQMKKSTRYEVNKGRKPETGFEIKKGNSKEDLDIFWALHSETVKRQGFTPFPRSQTEKELQTFGDKCQIISISHEGKALASGIFIFDDNAGYYHQGASVFSKLPAAHAYIWQAILEAKRRKCTEFNFWGVCGEAETKHPWFGLSKFKRGFGGRETNYLHVQDFPITWKYHLNTVIEKHRRKKRGY